MHVPIFQQELVHRITIIYHLTSQGSDSYKKAKEAEDMRLKVGKKKSLAQRGENWSPEVGFIRKEFRKNLYRGIIISQELNFTGIS
jgi:hypothetical protein